ncbi:Purine permease 3 [Linum perenne]
MSKSMRKALLILNCILLSIGSAVGPLVLRLYFLKGGKGVWIPAATETAGFPFVIPALIGSYIYRRRSTGPATKICFITWRLLLASVVVRQPFTAFSVNSVFLLCLGAGILAMHAGSDRPANETNAQYWKGFMMTAGAAVLYGFVLPAIELTYKKAKQNVTYTLVMEMQLIISLFATLFNFFGMIGMGEEAAGFQMGGKVGYWFILICSAIVWQCFFIGAVGVLSCGSSLLSAVFIYNEKFGAEKAVALILSIWGFVSYFYGEYKQMTKKRDPTRTPPLG